MPIVARALTAAVDAATKLAKTETDDGPDAVDPEEVARILASLGLDWSSLAADVQSELQAIAADGGTEALAQLVAVGVSEDAVSVDQVNAAAVVYARDRSAELVGMRVAADGTLVENPNAEWAITDSTRSMLNTDVVSAIEEGWSTDELAGVLADSYAFSDDRAETIARTEIATADVQGNLAIYEASGVVEGKEWLLGSEHDDADECDEAAAMGVQPFDSDWGGIGDPPAHPKCVCDIAPVVMDSATSDDSEGE